MGGRTGTEQAERWHAASRHTGWPSDPGRACAAATEAGHHSLARHIQQERKILVLADATTPPHISLARQPPQAMLCGIMVKAAALSSTLQSCARLIDIEPETVQHLRSALKSTGYHRAGADRYCTGDASAHGRLRSWPPWFWFRSVWQYSFSMTPGWQGRSPGLLAASSFGYCYSLDDLECSLPFNYLLIHTKDHVTG